MSHAASDRWERGDPYERYIGRWSRAVAPRFLDWLQLPAGGRWVDVGCGTGALANAILEHGAPAAVTGVEPSPGFLATARRRLGARATVVEGNATSLSLPDGAADVVVSALVLNFLPDPAAGVREMSRVACAGATIAAYVWDYAEGMQLIRFFWDAAVELDPRARPSDEAVRFPLCRPDALERLFTDAGLRDVATAAIEIATPFADFDDVWEPFLGGQGPAPAYLMALAEADRVRVRERLRARLPVRADGSIALGARAWAVRATLPAAND
jgi:SAM-dependent methyltransferase